MLDSIQHHTELIEVTSQIAICRDKKDNFLLSLCVDGNVDYLITGDEYLLVIKKIKKTQIIKLADFLKK